MSREARTAAERRRALTRGAGGRPERRPGDLVGRDLARTRLPASGRRRWFPALLVGAVVAALALAALRVEVIRQRYALAEVMQEQKRLLERRAALTAQMRSLRDPARLARLAQEMQLGRPERVIDLAAPAVSAGPRP